MEVVRESGLLELINAQWQDLPTGVGALAGDTYKFNDRPRDEIVWACGPGPGLMTRYAAGEFTVRMRLRPIKEGSDRLQLGCYRKPRDEAEGSDEKETWVPLIDDVSGLRIRYFDTRLNAWVERWTDTGTLPRLTISGSANRWLEAEAMACSGVEVAMHPSVKSGSTALRGSFPPNQSFEARITGEGGRLNLKFLLAGENPVNLELLRKYLEVKGVDLNEHD